MLQLEEQWESNAAWKVDKLVIPLLRNVLVQFLHFFGHTLLSLSPTHLFKDSHVKPCAKQSEVV
jgi:hypothetical protein